ncbi:hypothetical protein AB0F13_08000 [Streptomyces sp. NPDC026206]|uniref:hypothetical protein n=1 Tax=Streptomyces sp. NPDC026206 TaxID=3157089 RepID=UPI003410036E
MSGEEPRFCLAPSLCRHCRVYPVAHRGSDDRFSESLIKSVTGVLAGHGFPPVENVYDWAALEAALIRFLYRDDVKDTVDPD